MTSMRKHAAGTTIPTKMAMSLVVMGLLGAVVGLGTWSAFSATTANAGNAFESGTVELTDDDAGAAMLSLANAKPGDSDTSCITVTYAGSLPASVKLYGTSGGTGLAPYLNLTVTRGTIASPSFDSCTGFVPDAGGGALYSGTLSAYPGTHASGIADPAAAWATNEKHAYRFVVSVQDDNAAQGKTATATFTWEARNS